MKSVKSLVLCSLMFFCLVGLKGQNNSFPQEIVSSIRQNQIEIFSNYFSDRVELIMPSKSGIFSKDQSKMVMKDFFNENRVNSFQVIHEGTRDNSSYAIGKYSSSQGNYRFYFITKSEGAKTAIVQIRIDKQDD